LNEKLYEYDAVIQEPMIPGGYATVPFPHDVRAEFGKTNLCLAARNTRGKRKRRRREPPRGITRNPFH
jgi:hypothetical protein